MTQTKDKPFCLENYVCTLDNMDDYIPVCKVKQALAELIKHVSNQERIAMENIINRGLTEKERVWLQREVKGKLTDKISDIFGKSLMPKEKNA